MTTNIDEILDQALAQQRQNKSIGQILEDYPGEADLLRPLLETAATLDYLQPVEMPSAADRLADRAAFMAQLDQFEPAPVSIGFLARLKEWIGQHSPQNISIFEQKESKKMNALLLKAALVLTMVFGSIGGTAVMAAESLPDSPLYPVKLTIEEAQLALANTPAQEAALQMAFAQERVQEMEQMVQNGAVPDTATMQRLQTHWQQALQSASQAPDGAMTTLLTQAQTMVQNQEQVMLEAQHGQSGPVNQALQQAHQTLERTRAAIEAGLQDPQTFRHQQGYIPDELPQPYGPCPGGNCIEPPLGDGYPGPGDGRGNCDTPGTCEPAGDENHYGQDPVNDGHHGPGEPCDNPATCEPAGDEHHYGQDPVNDGSHGPGNENCTVPGTCDPVGDENQYGQDPGNGGQNGPGDCAATNSCDPVGDENNYGQDDAPANPGANMPAPPSPAPPSNDNGGSMMPAPPTGNQNDNGDNHMPGGFGHNGGNH